MKPNVMGSTRLGLLHTGAIELHGGVFAAQPRTHRIDVALVDDADEMFDEMHNRTVGDSTNLALLSVNWLYLACINDRGKPYGESSLFSKSRNYLTILHSWGDRKLGN